MRTSERVWREECRGGRVVYSFWAPETKAGCSKMNVQVGEALTELADRILDLEHRLDRR